MCCSLRLTRAFNLHDLLPIPYCLAFWGMIHIPLLVQVSPSWIIQRWMAQANAMQAIICMSMSLCKMVRPLHFAHELQAFPSIPICAGSHKPALELQVLLTMESTHCSRG